MGEFVSDEIRDAGAVDAASATSTAELSIETFVEPRIEPFVEEDLLVEDVSIDGMCGVY